MSDFNNVQNQIHIMLKKYVEKKRAEESTNVGGEIPYPTFVVFIGDRICKEAQSNIIPEMKNHWPTSFAEAGKGRLLYLLIDRNPDAEAGDGCGLHCRLTSADPLRSLADNTDDCRAINEAIREICRKASAVPGAKSMRLIAVTSVEDPDSLITGEVLALMRQFGKDLLNQIVNYGELFACFPSRLFLKEEGLRQAYDFWVKWKDWKDENGSGPKIYMRFGGKALPAAGGVPAFIHTYIFDSMDNKGIPDIDHWRDRLMVNVMEIARPADSLPLRVPGVVEDKLNYEYVLLKAMDPSNWKEHKGRVELPLRSADDIRRMMEAEIKGPEGDRVERDIEKWLWRACVSKLWDETGAAYRSAEKIEDQYFGTSVKRMFEEFKKEFLSRKIPEKLLKKILDIKNPSQADRMLDYLQDLIAEPMGPVPDKGRYSRNERNLQTFNSIWGFKEHVIDPAYIRLAPACVNVLVHNWAKQCRDALTDKKAQGAEATDVMAKFADIHNHEVVRESDYWGDILYDGPVMKTLSPRDTDNYRKTVEKVMQDPSEKNLFRLFEIVEKKIEDENHPSFSRIRAACQPTSAFTFRADGGTTEIDRGVSRGEKITMTIIPKLEDVKFAFDCVQYFSDSE